MARAPSPASRRAVSVRLTQAGHALIQATVRELLEHEADLISTLTPAERTALASLLAKLEQALTGLPQETSPRRQLRVRVNMPQTTAGQAGRLPAKRIARASRPRRPRKITLPRTAGHPLKSSR